MWINSVILFFSAILGGILFFLIPSIRKRNFDFLLVFAGAYLFSITLLHILPEVYAQYDEPFIIGAWVLAGFLLQLVLGSISSGVEHGHLHKQGEGHNHSSSITPFFLLFGLGIHSFLEGTIVAHPIESSIHNHSGGIMLGIVLHKFPAAVALMSILFHQKKKILTIILYLIIFSLASPAGLISTNILGESQLLSTNAMSLLYALVSGSFLHISTTIFFESSPQHKLDLRRMVLLFMGAGLALIIELFL